MSLCGEGRGTGTDPEDHETGGAAWVLSGCHWGGHRERHGETVISAGEPQWRDSGQLQPGPRSGAGDSVLHPGGTGRAVCPRRLALLLRLHVFLL